MAISERQGAALNASSLLSTHASLPLHPKQWEVEARQLFEISLARAQFEPSYMARGTYASYPGWTMTSPDIVSPKLCQHAYITNDPDFSNINGTVYLMILIPCLVVIVLSCPWNDGLLWESLLGQERAERLSHRASSRARASGALLIKFLGWGWDRLVDSMTKLWKALRQLLDTFGQWLRRQPAAIRRGAAAGKPAIDWARSLLHIRPPIPTVQGRQP